MKRSTRARILITLASVGASMTAGSAHLAYPTLTMLPPIFGYISGFALCYALCGPLPDDGVTDARSP